MELAPLAASLGYSLEYVDFVAGVKKITYVKKIADDLYEHLCFALAVENCICTSIELTVVPGTTSWRGLFEDALLPGHLATMRIVSNVDFHRWAEGISYHVPRVSAELAKSADALLESTAIARAAAEYYLKGAYTPSCHFDAFARGQHSVMSVKARNQAKQMRKTSLFALFNNSDSLQSEDPIDAYRIAINLIIADAHQPNSTGYFAPDTDPYENRDLAFCLQIMASKIWGEPGWQL